LCNPQDPENTVFEESFDFTSEDIENLDIVDDSLLDFESNEIQYIDQTGKIQKIIIPAVTSNDADVNAYNQKVIIPVPNSYVHKHAVEIILSQTHEGKNNHQLM